MKWTWSEPLALKWAPGKAPGGGERRTGWHAARSNEAGAAPGEAKVPQVHPEPAPD